MDDLTCKADTRRRLIGGDATALTPEALLDAVLPRQEARRAATWLAKFGGLRALLRASPVALEALPGLGPAAAARLKALQEIARRYHTETLAVGHSIAGPADTRRFLAARLKDLPYEVFCCLYLDNRHRVLAFEPLFRGTIDGTSVYPREVVCQALTHHAAALIVAHNHPSGVAEPSQADTDITRRLREALALVDIRLLDHLVIGDGTVTSLASRGLI
ncbi:MAG: DNA repair protein RadC [Pseudomonadota bacterium]